VIEPENLVAKTSLVIVSVIVLGITLGAGLWPCSFHKKNDVWWKPEQGGLYFGATGMAISEGRFSLTEIAADAGSCLELWIEPALTWDSSTILSFYDPVAVPGIQIRQSGDDVVFTSFRESNGNSASQRNLFVDHTFRKDERVLLTFTSTGSTLDIYVNGILRRSVRNMKMRAADFAGTLIVANAPKGNFSWTGTFRGLALYDHALRPEEIRGNYELWQHDRGGIVGGTTGPYSLYLFNEQNGERLHRVGKAGPDLVIPKNFFIFQPRFLTPFWEEYHPSWSYAKDLAINVFGLVPMGCCFAALLAWLRGRRRTLLYATMLGFCLSLTIEILQAFIPTRSSGTTDLITNTLGVALGGWLYMNARSQAWLERIGLVRRGETTESLGRLQEARPVL